MFDEDRVEKKAPAYVLGQPIDSFSLEDLAETIVLLKAEIVRLEAATAEKTRHRNAADALFGKK